jgi:hypothetical protein
MSLPPIGIVISTYQRPDGKTPDLLKRTLNSVLNQTYNNWKLYLIGDHYINNNEFESFCSLIPKEKLFSLNLPLSVERNRYPNGGIDLWHSGGTLAQMLGTEIAVNEGYDYVCALDHDEMWDSNHLELIAQCIEDTKSLFIHTKSIHFDGSIIPSNITSNDLYIKQRALPAQSIKSASCVNFKVIPLRRKDPLYFNNVRDAGDAYFLKQVNNLLDSNNLDSILINKVTVIHDEEGYTKTLNKEEIEKVTSFN